MEAYAVEAMIENLLPEGANPAGIGYFILITELMAYIILKWFEKG